MQIVIDIDEKDYQLMKNGHIPFNVLGVLMSGTPLPKGHGRLIDADDLYENTEIYHSDIDGYACVRWKDINDASTIVEADKEEEA